MKGKKASIYFSALIAFLMLILILPMPSAFSWSYGNPAKTDDTKYEEFGPRADKLLIMQYDNDVAEWGALEAGEIDVTGCPLDDAHYNMYTTPPWSNSIKVIGYGAEFGFYLFDLNNNNNQYLGNPPDPSYLNPVYPNPMSELAMRKAVAYLTARPTGEITRGAIYTPVPPSLGKYAHPDIKPGGALENLCYLYNQTTANATLDAGGFPVGPDGWRYWDRNHDGVKDSGEDFTLKIVARVDCPSLDYAGTDIYTSLLAAGVHCTISHMTSAAASTQVNSNKNFHLYTGYKGVSPEPDYLVDWNWDFYWHPGSPPNFAGCNDASFNTASEGVLYANDQAEAVYSAHAAQLAFATNVLSVPLWYMNGYKAVSRTYVGNTPEEVAAGYTGQYWDGFVNVPGYGVDNKYTFMNMHPEGNATGDGNMTIRYGSAQLGISQFNPIYTAWEAPYRKPLKEIPYIWDLNTLFDRRPEFFTGEFQPSLARNFTVSTYNHPVYGTCSKVKVTLSADATWTDGTPLTAADVYFTLVELDGILAARGLPPPSWKKNVMDILAFETLDPYNFEVLFDVKSIFALSWLSSVPILPKHVWKPICTTGDPTSDHPDLNMIGSGPWRLKEYFEGMYILLVANTPGTTVTSPFAGATPVTSPQGYWKYSPIGELMHVKNPPELADIYRIPPNTNFTTHWDFANLLANDTVDALVQANATIGGVHYYDIVDDTVSLHPNETSWFSARFDVSASGSIHWDSGVTRTEDLYDPLFGVYLGSYYYYDIHIWGQAKAGGTITVDLNGVDTWSVTVTASVAFDFSFGVTVWLPWRMYTLGNRVVIDPAVMYVTIREDITGSSLYDDVGYPSYIYKSELPSPDFKVDVKDVATAAKAFGSYPGHSRWSAIADINADYKIDVKDIAQIAKKFGWHG